MPATSKMHMSASETFYLLLPILHAFGALLAMGLSFGCDTGQAQQTARRPLALALPPGLSSTTSFMAAYPWDEGAEFETHTWNPFALIFVFEWLTAGFALRPLKYYVGDKAFVLRLWLGWLALGMVVFTAWTFSNTGGVCPAMLATVSVSFVMSGVLGLYGLFEWSGDDQEYSLARLGEGDIEDDTYKDKNGRLWKVPRSVCLLRKRRGTGGADFEEDRKAWYEQKLADEAKREQEIQVYENWMGVILRYAEYCITAPLLFLAVVCLLVTDAPAWLFLTGYWLLVTCNAIGIALHVSFMAPMSVHTSEDGGLAPFALKLFFAGPWRDPSINQASLLQAAWMCLLAPMGGLIYLTKDILFSTDMPVLVLLLIWNLLITYSLFGIVPTVVYFTRMGDRQLAWLLDVLNIMAKFPLPLIILAGFITRPATNKFCY